MAPLARTLAADVELAEVALPEHVPERGQALNQQLLAVGDEEDPVDRSRGSQALVVEGGDDGLPGTGRHHHEVAPPVVDGPLSFELVENLPLVAERADVERRDLDRQVASGRRAPR